MKFKKWLNRGLILICLILMTVSMTIGASAINSEGLMEIEDYNEDMTSAEGLIHTINNQKYFSDMIDEDDESEDPEEEPIVWEDGVDYMAEMIRYANSGDLYSGGISEQKRNLKLKDLDLDTVYPETHFFKFYDNATDVIGAIKAYKTIVTPETYRDGINYISEMLSCAEDNSLPSLSLGAIYERERNNKIRALNLDYYTTNFFTGEYRKQGDKIVDLINQYIQDDYDRKHPVPTPEPITDWNAPSLETYTGNLSWYCNCSICCGQWAGGPTASGVYPYVGSVAMPSKYSFGTKIRVTFNNGTQAIYICEDRGGAIRDNKIDVYTNSHSQAISNGRQSAKVEVIRYGR